MNTNLEGQARAAQEKGSNGGRDVMLVPFPSTLYNDSLYSRLKSLSDASFGSISFFHVVQMLSI